MRTFHEDSWQRIRVEALASPRRRTPAPVVSSPPPIRVTGERLAPKPLRTLATYRRAAADPTDVNFGQNFIHESKCGVLRVGDAVQIVAPNATDS